MPGGTESASTGCPDAPSDPEAADITYGRPAQIGNSGKTILVPTLADELRAQKPGARVVSLSLKARSAIGLAGHGGDAVVWFDDESGSFATSRAFASAPVPAVKAFIDAHPLRAGERQRVDTVLACRTVTSCATPVLASVRRHRGQGCSRIDSPGETAWTRSSFSSGKPVRVRTPISRDSRNP